MGCIDAAVVKHDKLKELEAKKEARKKKEIESANKTAASGPADTPRRTLFPAQSSETETGVNHQIENTTLEGSGNTANEDPRRALMNLLTKKNKNTIVSEKSELKSSPRKALLQQITKMETPNANQGDTVENEQEGIMLQSTIKREANDSLKSDRRALLHSISSNKSIVEQDTEAIDPRQSMLQEIGARKKKVNDERRELDPRQAMLQEIAAKKKKVNDEKVGFDPRQAMLQEIGKRKLSADRQNEKDQNLSDGETKEKVIDPRKATLQELVKNRSKKDLIALDDTVSVASSTKLLRQIIARKSDNPESKSIEKVGPSTEICMEADEDETDNVPAPTRNVIRSSRSLGCGIIPAMECAVTTFDPS